MADGDTIIIRGGSAEVEFDSAVYTTDPTNPKKHKNASKKIIRVLITDDKGFIFDTGEHSGGLKYEIKAFCN